jgi:hypothetical protein
MSVAARWESAAICDDCWDKLHPTRPSPRADAADEAEMCHSCGRDTRSGIYIRAPVDANGRAVA